jgi:hypothetical protein
MSDESVYNIIKEASQAPQKGPRYQSVRKGMDIPPTYSTFGLHGTSVAVGNVGGYADDDVPCAHPAKKGASSFGKPISHTIDPKEFLKMTGNRGVQPGSTSPKRYERTAVQDKKPGVPKKEEKPIMGLKSDKNFIVANVVENTLAVPKKKQENVVNTPTTDKFGKVPTYVTMRKNELQSQKNRDAEYVANSAAAAEKFQEITGSELKSLRDSLQARWEQVNREFGTMGFQVETESKKRRHEQLDLELRTIEAGLEKLGRARVFVYDEQK